MAKTRKEIKCSPSSEIKIIVDKANVHSGRGKPREINTKIQW